MPVVVSGSSITPAPMGAGDMIRSVLDYVQGADESHLREVARRELNLAIDEVNTFNWRRLVSRQDITLVAADDDYELASNFKEPVRAVLYLSTTRKLRLSYEPWATFLEKFDERMFGTSPGTYTIDYDNRLLVLEGTPDASFVANYDTLKLWYYLRLSYLTQDSDTHGGTPEFNQYLIWKARGSMAAVRGDSSSADRADARAARVFRNLRVNDGLASTDWE